MTYGLKGRRSGKVNLRQKQFSLNRGASKSKFLSPMAWAAMSLLLLVPMQTNADPIEYTFSGTGSGMVGTTAFADVPFRISVFADTANVVVVGIGVPQFTYSYEVNASSSTIAVTGIGSGAFTGPNLVFDNPDSRALGFSSGFIGGSGLALLDITSGAFANYALRSPLGPVLDPTPSAISQFQNQATSLGAASFTSARNITFEAQLVPEPSFALLCGSGLIVVFLSRFANNSRKS